MPEEEMKCTKLMRASICTQQTNVLHERYPFSYLQSIISPSHLFIWTAIEFPVEKLRYDTRYGKFISIYRCDICLETIVIQIRQ